MNLYSADGYIKVATLNKQFDIIESEIENVLDRSKKTKEISSRFKEAALENRKIFVKYLDQKSVCLNLESIFINQKTYSTKNFNFKKEKLKLCYKNLYAINFTYKKMNDDFDELDTEMSILMDMVNADLAIIPSLKSQLYVIKTMLDRDKKNLKSKYNSLNKLKF